MNNIIKRIWNQNKLVQIEDLSGMTFQAESGGHTFQIYGINDAGETVSFSGTPSGVFLRPDNTDVTLSCSVSEGVVSATLPAECYSLPGRGGITVFITENGQKTALYAAVVTVSRTSSGNVAPPATQTVVDLVNAISAAVATIPASYSALMADIAPTYSDSALYSVGQYAWYEGDLKRCISPITTAESFTPAHWTSAVLGSDVFDLKSALDDIHGPVCNSIEKSKNLLSINPAFIGTVNGVTIGWSDDGESIILNGTSTNAIEIPVTGNNDFANDFPAGTYTFKLSQLSGFSNDSPLAVRYSDTIGGGGYNIVYQNTNYREATITFNDAKIVYIYLSTGKTYTNASFKLQIESGSTATAYARPSGLIDYNARSKCATILENVPFETENKINSASFDVSFERYENIQYFDYLKAFTGISAYDNATIAKDNKIRFRNMPYSLKGTTDATKDYSRFRIRYSTGIPIIGTQEIEVYLYVENASMIGGSHVLRLQGADTGFSKYYDTSLVNGWNKIRFSTEGAGTVDITKSETDFRLYVYTKPGGTLSASFSVWIGGIYVVKPDKANLIIIDDGPYKTFYDTAYPALSAIGVPITWALDPMLLGDNTDPDRGLISQEEVDLLAYDGMSEFSFHSYDGTDMTSHPDADPPYVVTPGMALRDTLNSIRYLKQHGLEPERIFRAAWYHNDCSAPELANEVLDASASYNGNSGFTPFPFENRYNIPRYPMQSRSTSDVDEIFTKLKSIHNTIFMYTHGISDASTDVSTTLLAYYVSKITTGINEGWLNVTTYNRMMNHYRRIE